MINIIGFLGKAGAGKDETAGMLVDLVNPTRPAALDAFANPLYAGLAAMLDVPEENLRSRALKEEELPYLGRSPRYMLQHLGTAWGRELVNNNIWPILLEARHDEFLVNTAGQGLTIVTDCRFDNELALIKGMGGLLVHVDRDVPAVNTHISETSADYGMADITINNHGTLEDLRAEVQSKLGALINA